MTTATATVKNAADAASKRRSVALVFCCTLFGAAAQILIKMGANKLSHAGLIAMATNMPLLGGYALYGMSTILLVLALRKGQLSILYPVISLTYVWVTALSVLIFKETMNPYKAIGVAVVVIGVGILGKDGH
jgi:drug/metabolite transporter (DMT)-like permease